MNFAKDSRTDGYPAPNGSPAAPPLPMVAAQVGIVSLGGQSMNFAKNSRTAGYSEPNGADSTRAATIRERSNTSIRSYRSQCLKNNEIAIANPTITTILRTIARPIRRAKFAPANPPAIDPAAISPTYGQYTIRCAIK